MHLTDTESALALYDYGMSSAESVVFERFHQVALQLFESVGITATYVGIGGEGYADDYRKIGSRTHQKLLKSKFNGIVSLSITANPEGSDEPNYDAFATVSLGFADSAKELLLCFVVNEGFIEFGSSAYDEVWQSFLDLSSWDFGYGFSGQVEKESECHILGLDNGKLTAVEQTALNTWYGALPDERLERLRGIYPYNFVSTRQLANEVTEGLTLRQFIEQQQHGSLIPLTEYGLHLWKLDKSEIAHVRVQLDHGMALISA